MREVSPKELEMILKEHKKWIESNGDEGEKANLSYADLSERDLHKSKLNHAIFFRTYLYKADLNGVDFNEANLQMANLVRTNLREANLQTTDLRKANLIGADLQKANLYRADLSGAKLTGANLRDANLNEVNLNEADLCGADLSGAKLFKVDLKNSSLIGANLTGADLRESELRMANLREAILNSINLNKAILGLANLSETKIFNANLRKASLFKVDLSGARLNRTDLTGADLRHALYSYCDFSDTKITGAKICGAGGAPVKAERIICEWLDYSSHGDGSDIRYPGKDGFKDIFQTLEPQIIITSKTDDPDLFAGLSGLAKAMQILNAKVSKVENAPSGGTTITFTTPEEENIIPAVIVLFNALVKDGKIDFETLSRDVGDLKKIVVNDKSLFDLLKDLPGLIDIPQHYYDGLEKFRRGFVSQEIKIRGESVSIKREDGKLLLDYRADSERPRIEGRSRSTSKDLAKTFVSSAAGAAAGTIAAGKAIPMVVEVFKNLIK